MKKKMVTIDRIARISIIALIAFLFFTIQITGTLGVVLIIFAAVLLLASLISFCLLYLQLGLKTNKSCK